MRIHWPAIVVIVVVSTFSAWAQEATKKASRAEGETAAVTKVQPDYPPIAKQLKIQGEVELEAVVNEHGAVEKVNILSGNPVLTRPAMDALKKWKFKPFVSDGKAVTATVPVVFAFKM